MGIGRLQYQDDTKLRKPLRYSLCRWEFIELWISLSRNIWGNGSLDIKALCKRHFLTLDDHKIRRKGSFIGVIIFDEIH
jgi:hypothetical protein